LSRIHFFQMDSCKKSMAMAYFPIVRKVKNMIFNDNIICKKECYNIHNIPQSTLCK
jgi:hypothetical protein